MRKGDSGSAGGRRLDKRPLGVSVAEVEPGPLRGQSVPSGPGGGRAIPRCVLLKAILVGRPVP